KVVPALHIAHEEKAFEGFHIGTGRDHIHRYRDARIVVVAELRKNRLRVFLGLVCDLLAKIVALPELFTSRLNDVVCVAVGFRKYESLRYFLSSRKNLGQLVAVGADNGADLVGVDDSTVKLCGGVRLICILSLPPFFAAQALALLDLLARLNRGALYGAFGF